MPLPVSFTWSGSCGPSGRPEERSPGCCLSEVPGWGHESRSGSVSEPMVRLVKCGGRHVRVDILFNFTFEASALMAMMIMAGFIFE